MPLIFLRILIHTLVVFFLLAGFGNAQEETHSLSVTAKAYTLALNQVASDDIYHLYDEKMSFVVEGATIFRLGVPGNYLYECANNELEALVNFIDTSSALFYCHLQSASCLQQEIDPMLRSSLIGCALIPEPPSKGLLQSTANSSSQDGYFETVKSIGLILGMVGGGIMAYSYFTRGGESHNPYMDESIPVLKKSKPSELPQDELPQDELPQDELPQDELPQDELQQDELQQDELQQDELCTIVPFQNDCLK